MDSVNKVALTEETQVEESLLNLNIENNNTSKDLEVVVEAYTATNSGSKSSSISKNPDAKRVDGVKKNKVSKAQTVGKVQTSISRNQKPSFSKSISFPSRQNVNNDSKHTGRKEVKTVPGNSHINGPKAENSISDENKVISSHRRQVSSGGSSTDSNFRDRQSTSGKDDSVNATVYGSSSEAPESKSQNPKPMARLSLIKDDEDAHSTTSSTTPRGSRRSSGSEFTLRVFERAEKRKEFYSKLEEKTQAKEVEIKNLQAKSKESQELEIKQLRKRMTFVATPLPSFYVEPPPPKVELKKIPTTRAVSPKLGRHIKIAIAASDNSSEGSGVVESPRARLRVNSVKSTKLNSKKESVASKKPIQKFLGKLQSKKSGTVKTTEPLNLKPKTRDTEPLTPVNVGESQDQNESMENSKPEITTDANAGNIESETISTLPRAEITPDEVPIKV